MDKVAYFRHVLDFESTQKFHQQVTFLFMWPKSNFKILEEQNTAYKIYFLWDIMGQSANQSSATTAS